MTISFCRHGFARTYWTHAARRRATHHRDLSANPGPTSSSRRRHSHDRPSAVCAKHCGPSARFVRDSTRCYCTARRGPRARSSCVTGRAVRCGRASRRRVHPFWQEASQRREVVWAGRTLPWSRLADPRRCSAGRRASRPTCQNTSLAATRRPLRSPLCRPC